MLRAVRMGRPCRRNLGAAPCGRRVSCVGPPPLTVRRTAPSGRRSRVAGKSPASEPDVSMLAAAVSLRGSTPTRVGCALHGAAGPASQRVRSALWCDGAVGKRPEWENAHDDTLLKAVVTSLHRQLVGGRPSVRAADRAERPERQRLDRAKWGRGRTRRGRARSSARPPTKHDHRHTTPHSPTTPAERANSGHVGPTHRPHAVYHRLAVHTPTRSTS